MNVIERAEKKNEDKRKGISLVERAAAQTEGDAPKRRGIGIGRKPAEQDAESKRDPSAMTPLADDKSGDALSSQPQSEDTTVDAGKTPKTTEKDGSLTTGAAEASAENPSKRRGIGGGPRREKSSTTRTKSRKDALAEKLLAREGALSTPATRRGAAAEDPTALDGRGRRSLRPQKIDPVQSAAAAPKPVEQPTGVVAPAQPGNRKQEVIDLIALRDAGYITPDMPPNLMAEEFRIIKRSLVLNAFAKGEDKIKNGNVILVTSSNPGEGKSFCAINLALSIATEQDTTVLLVDADFSKPEVLNRLGVSGGKGLMDVVADKSLELGDSLVRTNIPNLVLLPAGRQHNLTTELLASERMQELVAEISTRYPDRIVIFDSPPVLASSAASVMALYIGQTVFVIEAERTTQPQIEESLNLISGCDHVSLLLNKTKYGGSNKKFATYYGYGGR